MNDIERTVERNARKAKRAFLFALALVLSLYAYQAYALMRMVT